MQSTRYSILNCYPPDTLPILMRYQCTTVRCPEDTQALIFPNLYVCSLRHRHCCSLSPLLFPSTRYSRLPYLAILFFQVFLSGAHVEASLWLTLWEVFILPLARHFSSSRTLVAVAFVPSRSGLPARASQVRSAPLARLPL